jgi:hypothetical protein
MAITDTRLGTITIDGETCEHDVVLRLSGEVVKRKKKLSKKIYGTSHTISEDEIRFVYEKGCKRLVVGTGQSGLAVLPPMPPPILRPKAARSPRSPHRKPSRHSTPPRRAPLGCFT